MMAHNIERGFTAKLDDANLNSGNEITTFQQTVSSTDYQRCQSFLSDSGSLGNVAMSTSLGIHIPLIDSRKVFVSQTCTFRGSSEIIGNSNTSPFQKHWAFMHL